MATLIKERRIVADGWQRLKREPDGALPKIPEQGALIVPLALWQARREELVTRPGAIGVWLEANEGPEAVAGDLGRFALVAVNFPKFGDGRAYTTARLLRGRFGYKGEIRAIGEVPRDHLYFMAQCGFDAFALRDGEDPQEALAALDDFSETYQASATQPVPLFRRRLAAGTTS